MISHKPLTKFIKMKQLIFQPEQPLELECGARLTNWQVAYHTYGRLNENADNVFWVCHALTANSDVADWWPGMVGPGALMDTDRYFIVCANIIGSCYGSTGPLSLNPDTGNPWLDEFPLVTVRDLVRAHQMLRKHLGIKHIHAIMGGSLGGQQAIEWAISEPDLFSWLIPVATNARASAWGIAFNESQRMTIQTDPSFGKGPDGGLKGMGAARSIALLSYRNPITYKKTQTDPDTNKLENFKACSYQQYQGEKLKKRFNAYSYTTLTKCLDSHHVGRGRGTVQEALAQIRATTLAIGITTDLLFPPEEQQLIADQIPRGRFFEINSTYGHDGFLIETEAIAHIIKPIINIS